MGRYVGSRKRVEDRGGDQGAKRVAGRATRKRSIVAMDEDERSSRSVRGKKSHEGR